MLGDAVSGDSDRIRDQDDGTPELAPFSTDAYMAGVQASINKAAGELDEEENRDILIYVVGEANAGKSSIINNLLGEDLAEVKPIAGWTRESRLYKYSDHLYVVDTPGLNESDTLNLGAGVTGEAQNRADITLFVVNLAGNRTPQERETYRLIAKLGRPSLVIANKVDTIDTDDRDEIMSDLSRRFAVPPSGVCAVSARTNEGMESLSLQIFRILEEEGGGLLWAKNARHRDSVVHNLVKWSAVQAVGIGVIPIPMADIVPLTAVQCRMWIKIGKIYGYDITQEAAKSIITSLAAGAIGKSVFRQALKALGLATGIGVGVTSALAGAVAGAMTYGLGVAAQEHYKSGQARTGNELINIYRSAFNAYGKSGI